MEGVEAIDEAITIGDDDDEGDERFVKEEVGEREGNAAAEVSI